MSLRHRFVRSALVGHLDCIFLEEIGVAVGFAGPRSDRIVKSNLASSPDWLFMEEVVVLEFRPF